MATTRLGLPGIPWRPYGGFSPKDEAIAIVAKVSQRYALLGSDTRNKTIVGSDNTLPDIVGSDNRNLTAVGV